MERKTEKTAVDAREHDNNNNKKDETKKKYK